MGIPSEIRFQEPSQARAVATTRQIEERRRRQTSALAQLDCLQNIPLEHLAHLAEFGILRAFAPGAVIMNERIPAAYLYLILRGTISLNLHDRAGREVLIGVLNRGDCFGEGPLFGDQFRGASAQAETICYILQISLLDVRGILAASPDLAEALRSIYRRRLVESTLGRVPLFGRLSQLERAGIAALLQPNRYQRGMTIIHEGGFGEALYLIESGQVVVEQNDQAIAYLDEGDFFGEMSLLAEAPHNANIRAITPVEVLTLPAAEFRWLLHQKPALAEQLTEMVERRRAAGITLKRDPARVHQFTAAVSRGMLRGSHILVRDVRRCPTGCQICEQACTTRHGHARIRVGGVTFDGMDVTNACRQCRVGAECVEACPSDAIQWNNHGALLITDACTACGECVSACPYDAVRMVARTPTNHTPLWMLWKRLNIHWQPVIPLETVQPVQRADKCDLCHGFDDLACVSACPIGALRLTPIEELFPL